MKLNLRQIEVFRAVMMSGTISGAARLLFVSQPAVSRLLSYTEQRLGLLLFERIKGRLHPTPEARRLFVEVGAVYQSVQRVNEVADNLVGNRQGYLRIACSPNLGQSVMPRAVALFCQRHPQAHVVMHTQIPSVMLQALLTQQVELGVAYMPVPHPSLQARPLYENRIVALVPAGHALARQASVELGDLVNEPFIGYSQEVPLGQLVSQLFSAHGSEPKVRVEVLQAHVACAMVQAGLGVALVDEMTVRGPIWPQVVILPLRHSQSAPVQVFHSLMEPLSRLAQEFITLLETLDPAHGTVT